MPVGTRSGREEEEAMENVRPRGNQKDFRSLWTLTPMLNFSAALFVWGGKKNKEEESLLSAIAEREEGSWRIWRVGNEAAVNLFFFFFF